MVSLGTFSPVPAAAGAAYPPGFVGESVGGPWNEALGLTFAADGRMYVWEKAGRIWVVENGVRLSTPFLDISDEVGNWRDHGLMSLVLHPNFLSNGYCYLLYAADFHHVTHFGTPNYVPTANQYFRATISRVTRFTARPSDGFRTADPNSRLVLIGESKNDGLPILDVTHTAGALAFGRDGTLLVSYGDSAGTTGGSPGALNTSAYASQAVADSIISPQENVDSLRAQMIDSLAGKVLRIDPVTGDGVPGNPYFDPSAPRSKRSRVWMTGLRNPFRFSVRPETGSHVREEADPGVLYIGDVGWNGWEELDVAAGPVNFGWPLFEGLEPLPEYQAAQIQNQKAPNPLYGTSGCGTPYFLFRDLIKQDSKNTSSSYPNPCDPSRQIAPSTPIFRHTRPVLDWGRNSFGPARTGIYTGSGAAAVVELGTVGSPIVGSSFKGNCAIGGVWYTGTGFPAPYAGTYFLADYGAGWVKSITFDSNDKPLEVRDFISGKPGITTLAVNPADESLYYTANGSTVVRVSYVGTGNRPPVAVIQASKHFGPGPLTVQFTGINSSDPDEQPLAYSWNFGDGTQSSTEANPSHTFTAPNSSPISYTVTLTVRDGSNATAQATLLISLNNTPPNVMITSPADGSFYPMTHSETYNLNAAVTDGQTSAGSLSYAWQVFLHHNEHFHPEPVITSASASTVISPIGCDGNTYYYRIRLTVTDPQGLSTTDEVFLYPYCGLPMPPSDLVANATSSTKVKLTWRDNSDEESGFLVERSYDGGPFLNIATLDPNVTSFVEGDLSSSMSYSYRVASFNDVGRSAYSAVANVTTPGLSPLPSPWTNADIGAVGLAGDAGMSEGTFILKASGADIADPGDAFHFVYRPWSGDGVFITKVMGVENTDTWAKAGIMFRRSLAANSAHAFMLLRPFNGAVFQKRVGNGGSSSADYGVEVSAPCWLKLERSGNTFNGYLSLDGVEWILVGGVNIMMEPTVYVGLALTSHNNSTVNTSTFASVQLSSPLAPALGVGRRPDGAWELTINGVTGSKIQSERSIDLSTWTPFSTNVNSTGTLKVVDPTSSGAGRRFYRAVLIP